MSLTTTIDDGPPEYTDYPEEEYPEYSDTPPVKNVLTLHIFHYTTQTTTVAPTTTPGDNCPAGERAYSYIVDGGETITECVVSECGL